VETGKSCKWSECSGGWDSKKITDIGRVEQSRADRGDAEVIGTLSSSCSVLLSHTLAEGCSSVALVSVLD